MEKVINLNFYGVKVTVYSDWSELIERLSKDFSYFVTDENDLNSLSVTIEKERPRNLPARRPKFNSKKVKFFDDNGLRYCEYPSGAYSIVDFHNNKASLYCEDLHAVHELTYLFILSRVGKALDQKGFHRLHGGAVVVDKKLALFSFPSGVGKTSLVWDLIKDKRVSLVSDDSPLISRDGKVLPFPVRFGFEEAATEPGGNYPTYELKRFHFGLKKLVSLRDIDSEISGDYEKSYLFTGSRGEEFQAHFGGLLDLWGQIFKEGVIGFGLPILFEYFWEPGVKDFWVKTKICLSRVLSFYRLIKNAQIGKLTLKQGKLNQNANLLIDFLEKN